MKALKNLQPSLSMQGHWAGFLFVQTTSPASGTTAPTIWAVSQAISQKNPINMIRRARQLRCMAAATALAPHLTQPSE